MAQATLKKKAKTKKKKKKKKNEWNNEQSKHSIPFQILWSLGIKYQSKPNICGKNMFLIHYLPF